MWLPSLQLDYLQSDIYFLKENKIPSLWQKISPLSLTIILLESNWDEEEPLCSFAWIAWGKMVKWAELWLFEVFVLLGVSTLPLGALERCLVHSCMISTSIPGSRIGMYFDITHALHPGHNLVILRPFFQTQFTVYQRELAEIVEFNRPLVYLFMNFAP